MNDSQCPAGMDSIKLCPTDSIPSITDMNIDLTKVKDRAYYIWKRYGNQDEVTLSSGL